MGIAGKVAVITGAAGGLGRAVTQRFVAGGAQVVTVHHAAAEEPPGVALSLQADVTDEPQVAALMAQVHEALGGPDILLNLVGGWAGGQRVEALDTATWQHMLRLNLDSAFLCCKHALQYMQPAGYGRIVTIGSKSGFDLPAGAAAYGVAKAAVAALTTALAHELKGSGVAACCLVPSTIDTPANRAAMPKADPARWVTPQQLAETLAWLASEQAGAVNGAIVPVYGGV